MMQFDNVSCGGMITKTVTSLKMDWTRWKRMIDISLIIHDHDLGDGDDGFDPLLLL